MPPFVGAPSTSLRRALSQGPEASPVGTRDRRIFRAPTRRLKYEIARASPRKVHVLVVVVRVFVFVVLLVGA